MQAVNLKTQVVSGLGEEMVIKGLITSDQLAVAEVTQRTLGGDLTHILIKKGFVQEAEALQFFAEALGLSLVELRNYEIKRSLLRFVPYRLAQKFTIIPLGFSQGQLSLAIADPFNISRVQDELHCEGHATEFVIAPRHQIEMAIQQHYQVHKIGPSQFNGVEIINRQQKPEIQNVEELAESVGIVEVVNSILEKAFVEKASDIHIEPQENHLRVRLRIDGALEERHILPLKMLLAIVSRIKILSGMNIAEKRMPQDGRFSVKIHGSLIDCRTSSYPTVHGEKIVIRLLSKNSLIKLEQLGMSARDREFFQTCISRPHGLILVTGPTGSGKSTTLYSALHQLNSIDRNILSIEDPVENEVPGVNQAQLNNKANITFGSVMRSMLRQDPDVIMVGEIRDLETAEMSLRAALTGHLVLSTLHTNTAIGAISRLINLGLPPFLVAASLVGVLGQRLVRKICPQCRASFTVEEDIQSFFADVGAKHLPHAEVQQVEPPHGADASPLPKAFFGKGCEHCRLIGFEGRVGLFEWVVLDKSLKKLIEIGTSEEELFQAWRNAGGKLMIEDGREKVRNGMTTIQEVYKVTENL